MNNYMNIIKMVTTIIRQIKYNMIIIFMKRHNEKNINSSKLTIKDI